MNNTCADMTFGINEQVLAVAQMLVGRVPDFADYNGRYDVDISTSVWYNGRERGLVFSMTKGLGGPVVHVLLIEHRNTDSMELRVAVNPGRCINPPSLETHGEQFYPSDSKWDDAVYNVEYGKIGDAAQKIYEIFTTFYNILKKGETDGSVIPNRETLIDWLLS